MRSRNTQGMYSPTTHPRSSTTQDCSHVTSVRFALLGFRLLPFRSPLLGEYRLVSFPPATEMFHFTGSSSFVINHDIGCRTLPVRRVTPLGYLRVTGCLPPYRSFSQAATSFLVFLCQGIHRMHFVYLDHNEDH